MNEDPQLLAEIAHEPHRPKTASTDPPQHFVIRNSWMSISLTDIVRGRRNGGHRIGQSLFRRGRRDASPSFLWANRLHYRVT